MIDDDHTKKGNKMGIFENENGDVTITLDQKMSGTGSIYDIESAHFEREITIPSGKEFAIVKAAYYNDNDTITCQNYGDAAAICNDLKKEGFICFIVSKDGSYR